MRWVQKPPVGTLIDPSHPLAAGLAVCVALNEGDGLAVDCARGVQATTNSGTWVESPYGHAVDFSGPSSAIFFPAKAASYSGPASFAVLAQVPSNLGGYASMMSGGGYSVDATAGGTHDAPDYMVGPGNTWLYGPSNVTVDGGWHLFALSHVSTATGGVSFYVDGRPRKTGTQTTFPVITNWLSRVGGNGGVYFTGRIAVALAWSRALLSDEQARLAANPWQLFAPPRDAARLSAAISGRRISYPRGSSALRPLHLPTADLYGYLD
jgi:hypothetical protein